MATPASKAPSPRSSIDEFNTLVVTHRKSGLLFSETLEGKGEGKEEGKMAGNETGEEVGK